MHTKTLVIILVSLIILIYIHYYYKYKTEYDIIQTYIDNIDIQLLYEKYPIVIYDQLKEPKDLLKTLFNYSYIYKKESIINSNYPVLNKSKYLILWNYHNDFMINIISPKYKHLLKKDTLLSDLSEIQYISVKLKQNQVIILPTFWIFESQDQKFNAIYLDDLISLFCIY